MPRQFTAPNNNIPPLVGLFIALCNLEDELDKILIELNTPQISQQEHANLEQKYLHIQTLYIGLQTEVANADIDLLHQIELFVTLDYTLILDGVPDPSIRPIGDVDSDSDSDSDFDSD